MNKVLIAAEEKKSKYSLSKWSDEGISIEIMYLSIEMRNKKITYQIVAEFSDNGKPCRESTAFLPVDLSAYDAQLKKMLLKAVIDQFF